MFRRGKIFSTCLLVIFLSLASLGQRTQYIIKNIKVTENFPSALATNILQDSQGFLWTATLNGLYRYDGYEYNAFLHDPSDSTTISDNFLIYSFFEDSQGNIWIGTTEGVNKFIRHEETFRRYDLIPSGDSLIDIEPVKSICQDSKGNLWFACAPNLVFRHNPMHNTFELFHLPEFQGKGTNPSILFADRSDNVWIDSNNGILFLNNESGKFEFYQTDSEFLKTLHKSSVKGFLSDNVDDEIFWIATEKDIYKISKNQSLLERYTLVVRNRKNRDNVIEDFFLNPEDDETLLVFTRINLYLFHKSKGIFTPYTKSETNAYNMASFGLWSRYIDNCSRIWFATEDIGLGYLDLTKDAFEHYDLGIEPSRKTRISPTVFAEDHNGNTWIGTVNDGLFMYDKNMEYQAQFLSDTSNADRIGAADFIYSLLVDDQNNIWAGNWGYGGLHKLSENPAGSNNYIVETSLMIEGLCRIGSILQDDRGRVWYCSRHGVFYIEDINQATLQTQKLDIISEDTLPRNRIRSICQDKDGNIWFASQGGGVYCLKEGEVGKGNIIHFKNEPHNPTSLMNDRVYDVCADRDGNVWAATGFGLAKYSYDTERFTGYNGLNGFDFNFVYDIECDRNNDLWLSTDNDLIHFRPNSDGGPTMKQLTEYDGVPFKEIYSYALSMSDSGRLYVAGLRGFRSEFYRFYPEDLEENKHIPPVAITDFKINNQHYKLDTSITEIRHIELKYNQNFISLEFAALDFKDPQNNQYAYYLDGLQDDWIYSGNRRFANYTGIPPGTYTFRVKASNNDGYWNEKGASVMISIYPPPWRTWWAYTIYGIALVSLLYAWRRYDLKRQRLKQELEMEHVQTEKLAELDRMKSKFFTNISHEFRTPLTLILGPVKKIINSTSDPKLRDDLSIVTRNAKRLQRLINQLLNLSQLDAGKLKIQAQKTEIVGFINNYVQSFESLALQKKIEYNFQSDTDKLEVFIDRDKMEKILSNLLSNAFKFTNEGGTIDVKVDRGQLTIERSETRLRWADRPEPISGKHSARHGSTGHPPADSLQIIVSDTGPGIDATRLPYIFDRFYHTIDDTYIQEGSGIGLALVKELVELHHGKIDVESTIGIGTRFTLYLPVGKDHLNDDELLSDETDALITPALSNIDDQPPAGAADTTQKANIQEAKELPLVMVVDDNTDMRNYIRGYLESQYHVIESVNGEEGLIKSAEEVPDLVVSDVMMPVMDGYEFCRRVKSDERTSHIPVILLTAKAGRDDKLTGLDLGADDYLTKPFDGEELLVRIKNLIDQRERLAKNFQDKIEKGSRVNWFELPAGSISSMDEKFLEKAARVIEARLHEPGFNTEAFGEEMALSHSQLYRKIKALTQLTPNEFIRTARLNKAALLIAGKTDNIAGIAYDVGFSSPSYFSECFKKQFGMLPSEFQEQS